MNPDFYIRLTIQKHKIKNEQNWKAILVSKSLYPIIRRWAHNNLVRIYPIGSFAKKTNITGNTDIDLFISLKSSTPLALKDIYENLAGFLQFNNLSVKRQNVSIRLNLKDIDIDIVVGKKQGRDTLDHSLYTRKSNSWIKTNVYKHISFVKKANCRLEILAVKIWRKLNSLDFPSFYLEMSVIEALKDCKTSKLSSNLLIIFRYLSDSFEDARIIDPANSNNIISDELNKIEKKAVKDLAYSSLLFSIANSWKDVIW